MGNLISTKQTVSPSRPIVARWLRRDDLGAVDDRWKELAATSSDPNPFFAPWALKPALAAYGHADIHIVCIFDQDIDGRLIALAPVESASAFGRIPMKIRRIWRHPHCYYAAPLIAPGFEEEALDAFVELLDETARDAAVFLFERLDASGPAAGALLRRKRAWTAAARTRAALFPILNATTADHYINESISKKHRKELNRLRNRLNDIGALKFESLTKADDLHAWTRQFLHLEKQGWKGRDGDALGDTGEGTQFFTDLLRGAFDAGALKFFRLRVDERPIALFVNFGQGVVYSFKTCFNEDFERYSPGVLLAIEATNAMLGDTAFEFGDSCAAPGHPMINRLWRERRRIVDIAVARRGSLRGRLAQGIDQVRTRRKDDEGAS